MPSWKSRLNGEGDSFIAPRYASCSRGERSTSRKNLPAWRLSRRNCQPLSRIRNQEAREKTSVTARIVLVLGAAPARGRREGASRRGRGKRRRVRGRGWLVGGGGGEGGGGVGGGRPPSLPPPLPPGGAPRNQD